MLPPGLTPAATTLYRRYMAAKKTSKKATRTARTIKKGGPDWAAFLRALRVSGNVTAACRSAGVGRRTVYDRRDSVPSFQAEWDEAVDEAVDDLEGEARRRAFEGTLKPVYGSGGVGVGTVEVGQVREYSDTLLIFLLKAHRPTKFRDNVRHEHTGASGGPLQVQVYIPGNGRDQAPARATGDVPRKPR